MSFKSVSRRRFDRIDSPRFADEVWNRKTYGDIVGTVAKNVSRNTDGTFRPSTNRSPERPVGSARRRSTGTV